MDVWLGEATEPAALLDPSSANFHAVTNIEYDAKGQRTLIKYGNGAKTTYTYDETTFRLVRLLTIRAGNAYSLQDLNYTYDPVGNITRIRDDAQQTIYFSNQVVPPNCDYTYDPIYRLISASGREHIGQVSQPETTWDDEYRVNLPHPNDGQAMQNYTEQYTYDAVGNFEQLIHQAADGSWKRSYVYNEASLIEPGNKSNRLSSTTVGTITEPYTYDAHGNMTSMPHLTLMQWDYKDELSATSRQAVNDNPPPNTVPETTFYVYDASGQRVLKVTERQNGTRKNERVYFGGFEIYREFKSNGNDIKLERETLHVMDDKQRIALVEKKTITNPDDESPAQLIRFQFSNPLGSASLELDDKANVISYEEYYPYGSTSYQAVDKSIKAAAKRYRYTGKERDEETGFSYHGARYYASWLGRWTSCDPKGVSVDTNLYLYTYSNPVCLIDTDGYEPKKLSWFAQARIVAGEATFQSATRVAAVMSFIDHPVDTGYGAVKNISEEVSLRYKIYSTGLLAESGPSAAVHALNETLSPIARAKQASDRAERAERAGDQEGYLRGKVQEVASLTDFAFLLRGVAGGVEAAATPKTPGLVVEAGTDSAVSPRSAPAAPSEPVAPPAPAAPATPAAKSPATATETAAAKSPASKQTSAGLRKSFMRDMLNKIKADKNHPLQFLIDPSTGKWRATTHLSDEPGVQAGHLTSRHSGATERFGIQDAFENQRENWRGETQGAIFDREAVDIGGVPVEKVTAQHYEAQGLLAPGTVENAPKHPGWSR